MMILKKLLFTTFLTFIMIGGFLVAFGQGGQQDPPPKNNPPKIEPQPKKTPKPTPTPKPNTVSLEAKANAGE